MAYMINMSAGGKKDGHVYFCHYTEGQTVTLTAYRMRKRSNERVTPQCVGEYVTTLDELENFVKQCRTEQKK